MILLRSFFCQLVFDDYGFAFEDKKQMDVVASSGPDSLGKVNAAVTPTPLDFEQSLSHIAGSPPSRVASLNSSQPVPPDPAYFQAQVLTLLNL